MEFQYRINFSFTTKDQESQLPLLFAARMMVIFLLWIRGMDNILPPFLPFFEGLNVLRGQNWLFDLLDWVYWISLVLVFAGIRFRFFSLVIGVLVFFSILSSRPQFSNSFLYSGCIFLLIGLYKPGLDWIFRIQIALLYLGAGLNKAFDPDWLSGQYFHYFFTEPYPNQLYLIGSSHFPENGFAKIISYLTILTELGLGVWTLLNKRRILLVILIHAFHLCMLLMTGGELSYIFYFLMAVSSYLILPWEEKKGAIIPYPEGSRFFRVLRFLDFDRFFEWEAYGSYDDQLSLIEKGKNKFSSQLESILFSKILYGFLILVLVFLCRYKNHLQTLY